MTDKPKSRVVTLILVNQSGNMLGELEPFEVEVPWLQEVVDVVEGALSVFGLSITVLRLLKVVEEASFNQVRYLAEVTNDQRLAGLALIPYNQNLPVSSKRLPYAEVGGPTIDLNWVAGVLLKQNQLIAQTQQIRTWNLSSIWSIDTSSEKFWLKSVPSFFAHEPKVIQHLNNETVPELVAYEGTRMLMHHIPGVDLYDASLEQMKAMITKLVDLQCQQIGHTNKLLNFGLQDWRVSCMTSKLRSVVERNIAVFDKDEQLALQDLINSLPSRVEVLVGSGLPDTLVHGDFHPGNWRGNDTQIKILDWGDCFIGHPLLDFPGLLDRVDDSLRSELKQYWCEQWRLHYPHAKLEKVSDVVEPLAALRMAWVYQMFLEEIEPSEHIYHQDDPVDCINRALALAAAEI